MQTCSCHPVHTSIRCTAWNSAHPPTAQSQTSTAPLSTHEPLAHPTSTAQMQLWVRLLFATLCYALSAHMGANAALFASQARDAHMDSRDESSARPPRCERPCCERPCSHRLLLLRGHDVGRPLGLPLDRPDVVVRGEVEDHRAGALVNPPVADQPSLSAV